MAKQTSARRKIEKQALDHIGGRAVSPAAGEPPSGGPPPQKSAKIGWMGMTGSVLWAAFFGGAGVVAWLYFTHGG